MKTVKGLARYGCLSRALVYFLVGTLALLTAMGSAVGATTDESGALRRLNATPFGSILLLVIAAGLFSYAGWRVLQSLYDHDEYGRSLSGLMARSTFFTSGVAHAFLGFYALNLVFQFSRNTKVGERVMAKWMMMQPYGRLALALLGMIVIATGFLQILRAFNGAFERDLLLPERHSRLLKSICRFGLVARGIVFTIIGIFFVQAARKSSSREAGGLHKAWETLRQQNHGSVLLGAVAAGFIAFAIFGLIEGFYRRRGWGSGRNAKSLSLPTRQAAVATAPSL